MTTCEIELEDNYRMHRRFDRMGRLIGDLGMQTLFNAHVMVVGVGGVGSFAAEALARSGVGRITLVDFDKICITNSNRQIHTMKGKIGKDKVMVMAERLRLINPSIQVDEYPLFYNMDSSEQILGLKPDWVIDAIDNITAKCHLLASCVAQDIKVLCSTGAAARMDPTRIKTADLSATTVDPLARAVRKILRDKYGFPEKRSADFGIPAVYSDEPLIDPVELHYDGGMGFRCVCPHGENGLHECEKRNRIDGTAGFVTGSFGLTCASVVVRALVKDLRPEL
jgi:tRNA A37 threonylcarbamoyladenosine dehydratase